ncbi:MAG: cytochrome c [Phycisphaerales bacterium]|nr:cytochrome c [Phycisphaerales bacterium]
MSTGIRFFLVMWLLAASNSCRREAVRTEPAASPAAQPAASTAGNAALVKPIPINNFLAVSDDLVSGAQPMTPADFDALADAGIRTIVSVDGAVPDAAAARSRGMRYVHLPIGYDGIKPDQRIELARALRDLPKPMYVHCHHGQHRGPAAAVVAAIGTHRLDCAQGKHLLEEVGTSPHYPGLWAAVADAHPLADAVMNTAPADFPERAEVGDFTAAMAAVDRAWDNLKAIQEADWNTPADHPDLVPLAEASRLADLFQHLPTDRTALGKPEDFQQMLFAAGTRATALEKSISDADPERSAAAFDALAQSCKECHSKYRN